MFSSKHRWTKLKRLGFCFALSLSGLAQATVVEMQTNMGNIRIQLYDNITPKTVANFLAYVNSGAYTNSFIHRDLAGFVVQGGGYTYTKSTGIAVIPTNSPVVSEYNLPNIRGTIAMALSGSNINSGTDEWFFNLVDNSASLNAQKFTVFGEVINNTMSVVDSIAALPELSPSSICGTNSSSNGYSDCTSTFANVPYIPSKGALVLINKIITTFNLVDNENVLISSNTVINPTSAGTLNNVTITNTQTSPVAVTLAKSANTVFVVNVKAGSTLNIPLPSGLTFTTADSFNITLPNRNNYSINPVYMMFDFQ